MKVLSYLEFSDLEKSAAIKYMELFVHPSILEGLTHYTLILMYKDLAKKPFKPELITGMFENFYHINDHEWEVKIANDKSGRLSAIENLPDYNPPLQPVN